MIFLRSALVVSVIAVFSVALSAQEKPAGSEFMFDHIGSSICVTEDKSGKSCGQYMEDIEESEIASGRIICSGSQDYTDIMFHGENYARIKKNSCMRLRAENNILKFDLYSGEAVFNVKQESNVKLIVNAGELTGDNWKKSYEVVGQKMRDSPVKFKVVFNDKEEAEIVAKEGAGYIRDLNSDKLGGGYIPENNKIDGTHEDTLGDPSDQLSVRTWPEQPRASIPFFLIIDIPEKLKNQKICVNFRQSKNCKAFPKNSIENADKLIEEIPTPPEKIAGLSLYYVESENNKTEKRTKYEEFYENSAGVALTQPIVIVSCDDIENTIWEVNIINDVNGCK